MKITPKQYIKSIFEESCQQGILESAIEKLEILCREMSKLKVFLGNPQKTQTAKMKEMISWGLEPTLVNFLFLLQKNRSLDKLPTMVLGLKNLSDRLNNILEVTVESSHQLDDEEKHQIQETLTEMLGKKIKLNLKTNPQILGGTILHLGDNLIDNSLKNRLGKLKNELLINS